jgi:hypothetical protein
MAEILHSSLKPFPRVPTPRLYVVDGAPSHMVPEVCDTLTRLGWEMYISPPNTTAYAQAMDQSQINQRFKGEVEHNFAVWLAEESEKLAAKDTIPAPPRWLIGKWVREAYDKITDTDIAQACKQAYFPKGMKLRDLEDVDYFGPHVPNDDSDSDLSCGTNRTHAESKGRSIFLNYISMGAELKVAPLCQVCLLLLFRMTRRKRVKVKGMLPKIPVTKTRPSQAKESSGHPMRTSRWCGQRQPGGYGGVVAQKEGNFSFGVTWRYGHQMWLGQNCQLHRPRPADPFVFFPFRSFCPLPPWRSGRAHCDFALCVRYKTACVLFTSLSFEVSQI